MEAVFLPDNEPYLGRESVYNFDQVIVSSLERNAHVARYTHEADLSALQQAACVIIPQGISLALAIRELVRQGYLFAAIVLMRPLIERTATISYLLQEPPAVDVWERGWVKNERPSLKVMLRAMANGFPQVEEAAKAICETFGNVIHGNPAASTFNLVSLGDAGLGYSSSKALDHPDLCDFICFQSYAYLVILASTMGECFPEACDPSRAE